MTAKIHIKMFKTNTTYTTIEANRVAVTHSRKDACINLCAEVLQHKRNIQGIAVPVNAYAP